MAEEKTLVREYVIPLRRRWLNVPEYERSRKAVKTIKAFIAKHMKVPERDTDYVKLDVYFNNEIWFRGRSKPPAKVKVKATKTGDFVKVEFVTMPQAVMYAKQKNEKFHKKVEKKVEVKADSKTEKKEEQTQAQKKNETEKEISTEEQNIKEAKLETKAERHMPKIEKASHPQRMALKK